MALATRSNITFTSPLAHTLQGKTPVAMSEAVASVGLTDCSGQALTHIRSANLETVLSDAPKNVGDVAQVGEALLARLRMDTVLALGESPLQNSTQDATLTVTDITHGRGHLLLVGQYAPDVLAKTCGLDFADKTFPNLHVAQTSLAKIHATIIRNDNNNVPSYHLIVGASVAEYVWGVVFDAMREFDGVFISED